MLTYNNQHTSVPCAPFTELSGAIAIDQHKGVKLKAETIHQSTSVSEHK